MLIYFESYLIMFLEVTTLYLITGSIYDIPVQRSFRRFLLCILVQLVNCLLCNVALVSSSFVINTICLYLIMFIIYKKGFCNTFYAFILGYCIIVILQTLLTPLFLLVPDSNYSPHIMVVLTFAVFLIGIVIYLFIPLHSLYDKINELNITVKVVLVNSFIIGLILVFCYKFSANRFMESYAIISIFVLITIFVNIELFISNNELLRQQRQLKAYADYIPIIDELITQIRCTQHDHNNHIQAIQSLPLTCSDYSSLANAIMEQTSLMSRSVYSLDLLKLNLKLVAGFLINKCSYARTLNKELEIEIQQYTLTTLMPEYELIDVLGILTDNAIEATPTGGKALLTLNSEKNQLIVKTKNVGPLIDSELCNAMFSNGYTTKVNDISSHGIGLSKLKNLVDHYHGRVIVGNEETDGIQYIIFSVNV